MAEKPTPMPSRKDKPRPASKPVEKPKPKAPDERDLGWPDPRDP